MWTPDEPNLHDLGVRFQQGRMELDRLGSDFAIRDIALGEDGRGLPRLMLNGEPPSMFCPLDQGCWPDGLYTAPTNAALRYDVEVTKRLGFNMARKNVKLEPARESFPCNRLGPLVWQDMPKGNLHRGNPGSLLVDPGGAKDAERPADSAAQFEAELPELVDGFAFFPSIVTGVPFNEGWCPYDEARIDSWLRERDPTCLVHATSG